MASDMVTVAKAAEISGYSEGHVRWLARNGRVSSERVGERVLLINRADLERYVAKVKELGKSKFAGVE